MRTAPILSCQPPGGAVKLCGFAPRDRCGEPMIHRRDIGDRVSQARVAQMLRQIRALPRKAGCVARRNSRQTAEVVMCPVDHVRAS